MTHIYGHTDRHLHLSQMTTSQKVNVHADGLASDVLIKAVESQIIIETKFPSEEVCLTIGDLRITGSPKQEITNLWGKQVAQDLFH